MLWFSLVSSEIGCTAVAPYDPEWIKQSCQAFIYIHDDADLKLILDIIYGRKTVETRTKNVFKAIVGKRVGLVAHVGRKNYLFGDCILSEPKRYSDWREFNLAYHEHRIDENSPWYKTDGGYGYYILDPHFCFPEPISTKGKIGNRSYFHFGKEIA